MLHENEISLGKAKDLRGQTFGIIEPWYRTYDKGKSVYWYCRCGCGKEYSVAAKHLISGKMKSCGCLKIKRDEEFINKRFEKLVVIGKVGSDGKNSIWKCKCDCGKIIIASRKDLLTGLKSCGCARIKDISGKRFGKLIALKPTSKRAYGNNVVWLCKCDCGNKCEVPINVLGSGLTKSCGCLSSSGELKVAELLTSKKIPFKKQKTFASCRFPDTNALARFDFYVSDKYLIEFDGKQHFEPTAGGLWEPLDVIQKRDNYKNQWCKENNVPLIRIPYTRLKNLCIQDLLLETSTYVL